MDPNRTSLVPLSRFSFLILGLLMLAASTLDVHANNATRASTFKLSNGMQVVVVPDHRAPVVTHMVWYRVGAADEPRGVSGIAHFLEHLMFKSTDKIPMGEFSKIVSRLGGQDNAFTGNDATAYFQRIAKERLGTVMEMEADRMVNLRLTEKEVLTERDVILEERRSRVDNNPGAILDEQMSAALYYNHPYGVPVIGWEHEIAKLTREDALAFYKRYYAPNNAILVVAGDVTNDEVKGLAEKTYGRIPANLEVSARARPLEPPQLAPRRLTYKDPRAGKASFHRNYLAPSYQTAKPGEAEALDLLMKIMLSGPTSRLYRALVVDKRLASSAGGWYSGAGRDYGKISIYAVAGDGATLDAVEAAIDEVIATVRQTGVTSAELERAKNLYIAEHVYESDSQNSLARRYGWSLVVGQTMEQIESWPDMIAKVTLDDVKAAAAKHLDLKRSVTGFMLPEADGPAPVRKPRQTVESQLSERTSWESEMSFLRAAHRADFASVGRRFLGVATSLVIAALAISTGAHAMKIQEVTSPKGIKAWLVEEHSVPLLALRFAFDGGNAQDPTGKDGVANFLTAMMDEGAGDLNALAFQERMEEIAMRMSFEDSRDMIYGSFETLTKYRDKGLDLLRLAVNNPRFDADAVERIRNQLLANIAYSARDPDKVASETWSAMAFPGHPYGRNPAGTKESVSAITGADLAAYRSRVFARDGLKVVAVGDIDAGTLGTLLDTVFGDLPAKAELLPVVPTKPQRRMEKVVEMDVPQSVAIFGFGGIDRKDPDFVPAFVVNHILGGGSFASRLMEEVREKRGLAYSVYSYMQTYKHASIFAGSVATKNDAIGTSMDVIKGELTRLATDGPTAVELENAKKYLTGSYALRFDSNSKIANQLLAILRDDLGIGYVDERNSLIEKVTLEEAKRVAARLLRTDDLIVTIVGKPTKPPG